ncbi:hypothetical protein ACFL6S_30220 [Candidatus Poribacteria bacterium]
MRTIALSAILPLLMFPLVSQALLWDFNNKDQENDWQVLSGICEIDDDAYKVSNPAAEALTITGESNWTDYTISGKARLTEPASFNNIAIAFRASDDGTSEYMFMLEGGRQQAEWWKKIDGGYTEIQVDPLEIELEDWFNFRVVVEGDRFDGYYEGQLISSIEDGDLAEGKVGFRVYGCTAHIDDFDVNGAGIPATSVESADKLATTWGDLKRL